MDSFIDDFHVSPFVSFWVAKRKKKTTYKDVFLDVSSTIYPSEIGFHNPCRTLSLVPRDLKAEVLQQLLPPSPPQRLPASPGCIDDHSITIIHVSLELVPQREPSPSPWLI